MKLTKLLAIKKVAISIFLVAMCVSYATAKDIYLVRHFEKQVATEQSGRDVDLTLQGSKNAAKLATWLIDKDISYLYTTNYKRTQQSIQPIATATNIAPKIYDPQQLNTLANIIKSLDGNTLVVGHSNTTGVLFALLGCETVMLTEDDYGDVFKVSVEPQTQQVSCTSFKLN